MTLLETSKLALEAMCCMWNEDEIHPDTQERITTLRTAIEEASNRTPSLWVNGTTRDCTFNPHTADNWLKQGHAVRPYYKD